MLILVQGLDLGFLAHHCTRALSGGRETIPEWPLVSPRSPGWECDRTAIIYSSPDGLISPLAPGQEGTSEKWLRKNPISLSILNLLSNRDTILAISARHFYRNHQPWLGLFDRKWLVLSRPMTRDPILGRRSGRGSWGGTGGKAEGFAVEVKRTSDPPSEADGSRFVRIPKGLVFVQWLCGGTNRGWLDVLLLEVLAKLVRESLR